MTSATEYLLELLEEGGDDAMDFWATVSQIAGATITAFSTEVPEWLKQAAAEQLETVFQYDYWLNVGETTREAVRATIERGINDGLSIREVADLIQEERGEDYARYRAVNTARTETNNALNRGASSAIETLEQETGLEMQKEWMSQYSTTTRPNHAAMDGQVSVGPNKLFAFVAQDGNTYNIPEPGDPSLPAEDRCQCGCGILSSFVGEEVDRSDLDAVREELLATDSPTLIGMERSHHHHGTKYSEDQPRDELGRFGEGSGESASGESESATPKRTFADEAKDAKAAGVQVLPTTTKAGSKLIASGVAYSIERMKSDPRTAEFMKDNPPPSNEQIEANWAKLLRSRKTYNKKAGMTDLDEELLQETQAAMIENGKNEAFQEMVSKVGPQRVLVRRLTDDDTERGAAEYHAGITHVYEFKGVELDKRTRAKAVDVEPKSGIYHMTDAGGMASMLRHEYGHQVLDTLGRDRQDEFSKTFNGIDSEKLKTGLTNYSAANPDELFAETFALMTHPKYKREEFPEFVGKLEDQIKGWINDYAAAKQ